MESLSYEFPQASYPCKYDFLSPLSIKLSELYPIMYRTCQCLSFFLHIQITEDVNVNMEKKIHLKFTRYYLSLSSSDICLKPLSFSFHSG